MRLDHFELSVVEEGSLRPLPEVSSGGRSYAVAAPGLAFQILFQADQLPGAPDVIYKARGPGHLRTCDRKSTRGERDCLPGVRNKSCLVPGCGTAGLCWSSPAQVYLSVDGRDVGYSKLCKRAGRSYKFLGFLQRRGRPARPAKAHVHLKATTT